MGAYGAIAGGVAGGIGGAVSSYSQNAAQRKAYKQYIKDQEALNQQTAALAAQRMGEVGGQYGMFTRGMGDTVSKYYDMLGNTDYTKFNVNAPDEFSFDYQGEVQRQLNPQLQAIIDRSNDAVQQSAASAGTLFSGSTGKSIARSTADIQAKEWDNAAQRAMQQQQSKYQQYIDKFNSAMKVNEFNRGNIQSNVQSMGQLYNAQTGMYGEQLNRQNQIQDSADTASLQGQQAINQARMEKSKLGSGWAAALSGGLSGAATGASLGGGLK